MTPTKINISFKGWERTSLIEYPDHIASVLFCGGCDFRCPMCHNASLVLEPESLPDLDEEEFWRFLARRRRLVDAVVVTGGEPTLQAGLAPFLARVHREGILTKVDTNGYHPHVLRSLLAEGLVDYVAMDIKAPPEHYMHLSGIPSLEVARIQESIDLLQGSSIDHEFRTTVVPGLLQVGDIAAIAGWIKGAQRYFIQQFRPMQTLDPGLESLSPYPLDQLQAMASAAAVHVQSVALRGAG